MAGWYRMHRGWMDHDVFGRDPLDRRSAFMWLIENAAFAPAKTRGPKGSIVLQRGQLSYSLRYLAAAWRWPEPKVRRFLRATQDAKIIDAATDAGQMVITVCNYDKYQTDGGQGDAVSDALLTQPPRVTDANNKKDKEKEGEEGGAPVRRRGGYAFAGATVRLNDADLAKWKEAFSAIPDIRAELTSIDAWWQTQPGDKRKGWFHATAGMLNRRHQEALSAPKGDNGKPLDACDEAMLAARAFVRRMDHPPKGPGPSPVLRLVS